MSHECILTPMKKIVDFIAKYAYIFMMVGFVGVAAGLMYVLRINNGAEGHIQTAWIISGIGLFAYAVGRIGVMLARKNRMSKK